MKNLLLLAVIALSINTLEGQIAVNGYVFDKDTGQPIQGAKVIFSTNTSHSTETNAEGEFYAELTAQEVAKHSAHFFYFHKPGYEHKSERFRIPLSNEDIIIKLSKSRNNGFYVQIRDEASKQVISDVAINIPGGNSVVTDNFGMAFIELENDFNEYEPIHITCIKKFIYEDKTEETTLKEVTNVYNISLKRKTIS